MSFPGWRCIKTFGYGIFLSSFSFFRLVVLRVHICDPLIRTAKQQHTKTNTAKEAQNSWAAETLKHEWKNIWVHQLGSSGPKLLQSAVKRRRNMFLLQFHLTHCGNKFQKCIYLTKTALFSVLFFYNTDLNCFANHSILCLGLWISTTGKNKIHSLLESRSGRDCRHTDPHVKQTRWAGSSYRAGSSSQWKPCHTLIMHRFAKSACSQALACWTSSGCLAHQFCIFNTSDDSLHSDWEPWP